MHTSKAGAVVRRSGEGERRWFFGGGIWTWKLSGAEAQDGLLVVEVELDGGKRTPLHTHPIVESMWVLDGSLRFRVGDDDHVLDTGDYIWVPSETPHAFLVESEHARVLVIQPGCECEAFFRGASEPMDGSTEQTDFDWLAASAVAHGGMTIVGPPTF